MQYIPEDSNLYMNKCSHTHTISFDTILIVWNTQNFQILVASNSLVLVLPSISKSHLSLLVGAWKGQPPITHQSLLPLGWTKPKKEKPLRRTILRLRSRCQRKTRSVALRNRTTEVKQLTSDIYCLTAISTLHTASSSCDDFPFSRSLIEKLFDDSVVA